MVTGKKVNKDLVSAGVCVVLSAVLFVTPWTGAHQTPLSMEFSRQENWSGLPCLPPEDLLDPGIEHAAPALQAFFTVEPVGKP